MRFPDMYLIKQNFPDHKLADVSAVVHQEMAALSAAHPLKSGSEIAIAVGSRGIKNLPSIVKSTVDHWKAQGMRPFIFPAMGSHDGANANGQKDVLAELAITEDQMGCPIISSMETVKIGEGIGGIPVFLDKRAFDCGHIFVINRIKWHTDFVGRIESGLCKMIAIGLGKDIGASTCHQWSYSGIPLGNIIESVSQTLLDTKLLIGGLAILENAYNNTSHIEAVPALGLQQREIALLKKVKAGKANLPAELDLLIIDTGGKTVSGPYADTTIINRDTLTGHRNPRKDIPWVGCVYARSLLPESLGNAMGMGLADVIHRRILWDKDTYKTKKNALTAQAVSAIRIPAFHACTDRRNMLDIMGGMLPKPDPLQARIGWIRNTLELSNMAVSDNLIPKIKDNPDIDVISGPHQICFTRFGQMAWEPFGPLPQDKFIKRYALRAFRGIKNAIYG